MADQKNQSLNNRIDSIHEAMFDSTGYFFIKDLKGSFLYLNKNVVNAAGSNNLSELLGKNDFHGTIPWVECARTYTNNDNIATSGNDPVAAMELMQNHKGATYILLVNKKPFKHNGKTIGVIGVGLETPSTPAHLSTGLSSDSVFFDSKKGETINFTPKQKSIAYYLLQGFPVNEISKKLCLSPKTIAYHIDSIKNKSEYKSTKEILLYLRII